MCACGFIEISGNTVGKYQRNLQQCLVSLSFSDSLLCYLQVVCVQLQMAYICLNLLCRSSSFSLAGTELFVVLVQSICVLSERMVYTSVGEGVRQRCQRAQWVKGQNNQDEGKEWSFLIGKDD